MVPLDDLQLDALGETFNIGVGRAAAAMGGLVGDEVELSVPHVGLLTVHQAARELDTVDTRLYAVRQPFRGLLSGDALLVFPGDRSLEIVRLVAGHTLSGSDLRDLERDAMTEVGNVMLNACIAALSELLHSEFHLGAATLDVGDGGRILRTRIQNHLVVFLHIRFELRHSRVGGYVVFVLHTTSLDSLRRSLDRLLGRPDT